MKGFTLIEVMISVVILGFGAMLIANTYIVALNGVNTAQGNIQALTLARAQFTELEISSLKEGLAVSDTEGAIKSSPRNYAYTLNVGEIDEPQDLSKSFVRACLKLSWSQQNSLRSIALSSYFLRQKE